jgi:hypothetical protein
MTSTSLGKAAQVETAMGNGNGPSSALLPQLRNWELHLRVFKLQRGSVLIRNFLRSGLKLVNQVAHWSRHRLGDSGIEPAVELFRQKVREVRRVGSAPCAADAEIRKLPPLPDHRGNALSKRF